MSAYKSELAGLLAFQVFLHHLCSFLEIRNGQITVGCNGLSELQQASGTMKALPQDIPSYDVIAANRHLRLTSPLGRTSAM
jgi:hypothetical protein